MSDPSALLLPAMLAALRGDAGVLAAHGGAPKVYDDGVTDIPEPYTQIGAITPAPALAECMDATEVEVDLHVWSRTDPPGRAEAMAIVLALFAVLAPTDANGNHQPPALVLAGFRIVSALPVRVTHLMDLKDAQTAHSIATVSFVIDPL